MNAFSRKNLNFSNRLKKTQHDPRQLKAYFTLRYEYCALRWKVLLQTAIDNVNIYYAYQRNQKGHTLLQQLW